MIFAIEGHIQQIIEGAKTQTRRLPAPGESFGTPISMVVVGKDAGRVVELAPRKLCPVILNVQNIYSVYTAAGRLKYRVGNDYAIIPKRGAHGITDYRTVITRIRYEDVRTISEADAKAEGGYTVNEYLRLWASMADKPAVAALDGFARAENDLKEFPDDVYPGTNSAFRVVRAEEHEIRYFYTPAEYLQSRPADRWQAWVLDFEVKGGEQ